MHTLRQATQHLEEIIMQLAILVEEQLGRVLHGTWLPAHNDVDTVLSWEPVVDLLHIRVNHTIETILQQWAPMGPSLQHILTLHTIAQELERMGNYAVALTTELQPLAEVSRSLVGSVHTLTQLVRQQVRYGVMVLADATTVSSRQFQQMQDAIGHHQYEIRLSIQYQMAHDPDCIPAAVLLLFAIHTLELISLQIYQVGKYVHGQRSLK